MDSETARHLLALAPTGRLEPAAVNAAYRSLARVHHPDHNRNADPTVFPRLVEARDYLIDHPEPPPVVRRLTAEDFLGWRPRADDQAVAGVVDVLRGFEDVLAGLGNRPPPAARARVTEIDPEDLFESARGVFHDTGWTVDRDDAGVPYLVVTGIPTDSKLVVRAAGDRLTLLAPDGSALTVDFNGHGDYRPPGS